MKFSPAPKYMTFDVFSALFDWEGSLAPFVQALSESQTKPFEVTPFLQLWRRTQLEYTYLTTMLGKEHLSFETLTRRALNYTLKFFHGVSTEDRMLELVNAWSKLNPFPDVRDGLIRLKEKCIIGMLSNGDEAMLGKLAERLGVKFQSIIAADTAGVYKPHPKIYKEAVRRMGNNASDILHVAGSSRDAIGAKMVGMKTAWINRKDLPMDWDYPIDLMVKSFGELTASLLP